MTAAELTPAMRRALDAAARHPEGLILGGTTKTTRALIRRGYADGCYITEAGRDAVR